MSARSLLGRPVDPYIHDEGGPNETSIALKVPKLGEALPILTACRDLEMLGLKLVQALKKGEAIDENKFNQEALKITIPLVRCCLVEEFDEDETFELLVNLGVEIDANMDHPLLERCFALIGQPRPDKARVASVKEKTEAQLQEEVDRLLADDSEAVDPT